MKYILMPLSQTFSLLPGVMLFCWLLYYDLDCVNIIFYPSNISCAAKNEKWHKAGTSHKFLTETCRNESVVCRRI